MERLPKIVRAPFLGLGLGLGQGRSGARETDQTTVSATGATVTYLREGDSYHKLFVFDRDGSLTVGGGAARLEMVVVAGSGDAATHPGEVRKFVAGEAGNTEPGRLLLGPGSHAVTVGDAGGAGRAGGDSSIHDITASGGAA